MPSISRLDLYHVAVPLKKPIKHASHERSSSDSLVTRIVLDDGSVGFGEGVPRDYVTGESIVTAFSALEAVDVASMIGHVEDFATLVNRLDSFTLPSIASDARGMFGNAARSAVELAILDAFGRSTGASVSEAVRIACRRPELVSLKPQYVRYSGAITAESPISELRSAVKMRLYGFHQVKLKVGVSGQDDEQRLASIRRILGRSIDIRLDANEAWAADELLDRVTPLRRFSPTALEQPVAHAEVGRLAALRPRLGLPIMLDESLCGYPDGLRAVDEGLADLFNVRISKCGGIIPTLRLIELAAQSGLGVQLGCHPGETGLLSAAGRHLAGNINGLRYVEGSYDQHVLKRNLIRENITFHYGGWAKPLTGQGLGVTVDPASLEAMTVSHREIRYD
jgi:L-alanine-DL-glutamate epimerase-like enolase superfamily enzyme